MKVGVYRYSALGDIAAALPVLRAFEEKPIILTSKIGYELCKDEFDDFVIQEGKSVLDVLRFLQKAKKRVNLFIDLQNNDRSKFLRFWFKYFDNKGISFEQSVTQIFYDIAKKSKMVGDIDTTWQPKPKEYIVLNTGSSPKWVSKRLPVYKWREFSEILWERFGLPFVLTGDNSEREYVESIAKEIVGKKEIIAGKTTIQELKKVLSNAYLCVSTDSAPMHIAAVQKTPTIGLFGATSWIVSAPFGPWSVALWDEKRYKRPHPVNQTKPGNYYEGIDITVGLEKLKGFL